MTVFIELFMAALIFWQAPPVMLFAQVCLQASVAMLLLAWVVSPPPPDLPWREPCSTESA